MQPDWRNTVTLVQGETFATRDPRKVVSTVLGSCVSICLFDIAMSVGGINHFLLADSASNNPKDKKYGLFAFETLLNEIMKVGGDRRALKAKVFGGAQMQGSNATLGHNNAMFAKDILTAEGIDCISHDTGGNCARRIKFHPASGQVKLAVVPSFNDSQQQKPVARNDRGPATEIF